LSELAVGASLATTTGHLPTFDPLNQGRSSHLQQEPAIRIIRLDSEQAPVHQ